MYTAGPAQHTSSVKQLTQVQAAREPPPPTDDPWKTLERMRQEHVEAQSRPAVQSEDLRERARLVLPTDIPSFCATDWGLCPEVLSWCVEQGRAERGPRSSANAPAW